MFGLNCFSIKEKINLRKTTSHYIGTRDEEEIYEPKTTAKSNKFVDFLIFFSILGLYLINIYNHFSRSEEFLNESSGRIIKRIVLSLESFSYQLIVLQLD